MERATAGAATLADSLPPLSGLRRAALGLGCGVALTLAQPPVGFWPALFLAWPALAALIAASDGPRRAAVCGFWAGFGFFATGLYWVGEAFLVEAAKVWWYAPLMPVAVAALAAVCAAFWAGGFALARLIWRRGWRGAVSLGLAMLTAEVARGAALTGFPWALQAYAWIDAPVFQAASVLGAYALGAVTVTLAALPAFAARRAPGPALAAALCVALLWGGGAWRLAGAPPQAAEGAPVLRLVQPNTAQVDKWAAENRRPIFETLLRLSGAPAETAPALILWPEVAVTFLFDESAEAQAMARDAAGEAALVVGAVRRDAAGGLRNSLLFQPGPDAPFIAYDKAQLTPFGEYVPYAAVLARLGFGALGDGFSHFTPGAGPLLFEAPGLPPAAPLICYEIVFPGAARRAAQGAGFILQATNDAWFGESAGPWQHLAQARARAVELGLPVARAASTGISAMIDPYGRITAHLGLGSKGFVDSPLPAALPPTPLMRLGHAPVLASLAILAALVLGPRESTARHS